MSGRIRLPRTGLALAVLAIFALSSVAAAGGAAPDPAAIESADIVGLEQLSGPVMIELAGEPSAVVYSEARGLGASKAKAGKAARDQKAANDRAQERVLAAIEREDIDATPLYTLQTAYNGIAVQAEPGAAADLAALPGVAAVHPIPLVELDNAYTVPLIGALQAWQATGGTGQNVSIAVIDTGVDYVHTHFGGSGSSADYAIANSAAANPLNNNPFDKTFTIPGIYPSAKVVGGWDFAGDAYNGSNAPRSDPNPMDCNGHGSHVAGTAAGYGVNDDFSTYTGPYDASTDTDAMHIGPGVAPQADVYALRVFGCAGSTGLTAQAINWAVDPNGDGDPSDHLDVINMSLGSAYGTVDDPSAAAAENAAATGVLVVASAGNNTDVYYVTGSPASSTRTLSVASSADQVDTGETIRVNAPAAIAGDYFGSKSVQPALWNAGPSVTGNLYYPAVNQYGCNPFTGANADPNVSGRILLIDWKKPGDETFPCGSAARANNATAAGAIGIIMVDNLPYSDVAIAGNATTRAMVTTSTVGDALKSQLTPGVVSAVDVTLDSLSYSQAIAPGRDDTLSGFTSRGPRARGSALKPDITAPGQSIWSADSGSGFRGRSLNGTSMAAPHAAGVMALLKQSRPSWTVQELKALAMNTANHDLFTGFDQSGHKYGVGRVGAGRVNVASALTSNSIAYNAAGDGSVGVSFGALEVSGALSAERTIRVVNKGSSAQNFAVAFDERMSIPGVSISIPGGKTVRVPAGGSADVRVRLHAVASQMTNTRDPSVAGAQVGFPRHWLSEAGGLVTLTPASGPALRVPVYATARPASKTKVSPAAVEIGPDGTGTMRIGGQGVDTGEEPLGWLSKVSAFELTHTSGLEEFPAGRSELARNGDIQYVGVATKVNAVHFGIAAHGDWSTAASDVQFLVQFDTNNNTANVERTAFTTALADGNNPTDVFVVGVGAGPGGTGATLQAFTNIFNSNVNTAPFNNNVMVVTVPIPSLLLPAGQTTFNYRVVGFSRFWGTIETTPWMSYDHASPGLAFSDGLGGRPMYPDVDGQEIGVTYDAASFAANGSQGVLLLHHFHQRGNRTEVLPIKPN